MMSAAEDEQTVTRGQSHAQLRTISVLKAQARVQSPLAACVGKSRLYPLLTTLVALCGFCGCGPLALTGGGIPDGKSRVVGRVLVADNPQQPLANLAVTVFSTPAGRPTVSYRVTTDAQGQFAVNDIVTGKHIDNGPLSYSNVVVSVDPGKTPFQAQKTTFLLTEKRATDVVLAMPPTSFDANQIGGVSVSSPATNTSGVASGSAFQIVARLLDRDNKPLVSARTGNFLIPNLVLDGLTITSIGTDGTLNASGAQIGVTSITGQADVPGDQQAITSPRIDLLVQPSSPTSSTTDGLNTQFIPAPPNPLR